MIQQEKRKLINFINIIIIMKVLNKLTISSEKILKSEELINLKGGGTCWCYAEDYMSVLGNMAATDWESCSWGCWSVYKTGEISFDA